MPNDVVTAVTNDNDVTVNVTDYDEPKKTCCPKEVQVCVTIKLNED